ETRSAIRRPVLSVCVARDAGTGDRCRRLRSSGARRGMVAARGDRMSAAAIAIRATDPFASAWVSANAGAGKTHLLTDRVTRLLLSGADPSRILCLTYTKAAASEMAKRLFDRLGAWSLLTDSELRQNLVAIGAPTSDNETLRRAR